MIEFKINPDQFGLITHETQFLTKPGEIARNLIYEFARAEVGAHMASAMRELPYSINCTHMAKTACDVAEAIWAEMVRREFVIDGPTVADLENAIRK